ncbi:ABC transporter permease subunit, partial [Marinobacter sp.]
MMARLSQFRLRGLVFLAVVAFSLPLFLTNPFHYGLATQIALIAGAVVGLNLLVGFAGQISLGHAGFFGLGAYFSAIMTSTYGWSAI